MSSDIFQEISEDQYSKMLEALQQDWPKHFLLYQIVTVMTEYKKAGSTFEQTAYLHGDYNTGVYLHRTRILLTGTVKEAIHVYTLSSDLRSLEECLKNTEIIPWQKGFLFHIIDSKYRKVIEDTCALKNVPCRTEPNTMFWFPLKKEICDQQIPEDVCLEFLDESYAKEMDKTWVHKFPNSELMLAENIRRNFAIGLFRKSDKRLLSSALSTFTGGVFVLYTDPEFRGRGYARLVVESMAREIRRRNRIPFGTILLRNKPSQTTFTRAGYEPLSAVDYIIVSNY